MSEYRCLGFHVSVIFLYISLNKTDSLDCAGRIHCCKGAPRFMSKLALPLLSPSDTKAESKQFLVNSRSAIAACMNWNKIPLLVYIGSYDHAKKPLFMKPGEVTTFHVNILKFDNSMFWFGFERPIGGDSLFGVYFSLADCAQR